MRRQLALTFDDGPWPPGTGPILDLLAARGARATFYIWGEQALEHPAMLRAMLEAGHAVEPHCWSHVTHHGLSSEEIAADIDRVTDVLRHAGAKAPRLWRPPWGQWRPGVTDVIASDRGLALSGWTVDTSDYAGTDAESMLATLIPELEAAPAASTTVVLLHDSPLEQVQWGLRQDVDQTIELVRRLLADDRWSFVPQPARVSDHLDPAPPQNP